MEVKAHRPADAANPVSDAAAPASRNRAVARMGISALAFLLLAALALAAWAMAGAADAPQQQPGGTLVAPGATGGDEVDPTRRDTPIVQAPPLVSLLGMECGQALQAIGHGATVRAEEADAGRVPAATKLAVALADVRSKDGPGAPTAYLWVDASGTVVGAGYSAALRFYGYTGAPSFAQALDGAHAVEAALNDAGVDAPVGTASCPKDRAGYSTYGDDGRTLVREHAAFAGDSPAGGTPVAWAASLDYDYTRANETGNLVYTRRILSVEVWNADGRAG